MHRAPAVAEMTKKVTTKVGTMHRDPTNNMVVGVPYSYRLRRTRGR